MELQSVSKLHAPYLQAEGLTLAPILPLIVITIPMTALPSTSAPMAILQLRPVAIIDDAGRCGQ
jgi:hypothetical protein